ncbi:hypothetical protein HPP92_006228 [Vanilla planifolia]|uniref:Pentatricopeptide repeat-containing protein n=1 Tax=Vanilla planifolia TaxID=51239 RepID=A0A835VA31_VANPL|nr:hypothetical protein HPP92_006517 [Vanilla planifolia]KAG0495234.1 hypothetical protein HPP92_006228 [Vanilla planifolia]
MVSGLANYGHLDEAIQVFDQMPARDSVSWNSLMSGYFRHGCFVQTMHVFVSMFSNSIGVLDVFSLAIAMKACGALQFYRLGLQLHGLVEKLHFGRILHINRSLIDMHIKCGFARMAASIFERMENPDLFCWNSMIIGYMRLYGIEHALMVFSNMPKRDTISWNTIISLLLQQGHYWETMSMILDMHTKDFSLSSIAYACGLGACTRISDLAWGKHLHARIVKLEPSIDVFVGTALVDMYAKNGDMDTAKRTFDSLPNRNTTTWTSFIGGFAQNGYVKESAAAFNLMRQKQVWADEFTLSTVISACYNGVVANIHFGCQMHCFCVKTGNCLLTPVSNALLTMYARCEMLECAESIFHAISSKDVVSWTGMITAQAQVGNIGKAREFFSSMDARNVVTWNAIFGAYIQNGMEEESLKLFVMMLRKMM